MGCVGCSKIRGWEGRIPKEVDTHTNLTKNAVLDFTSLIWMPKLSCGSSHLSRSAATRETPLAFLVQYLPITSCFASKQDSCIFYSVQTCNDQRPVWTANGKIAHLTFVCLRDYAARYARSRSAASYHHKNKQDWAGSSANVTAFAYHRVGEVSCFRDLLTMLGLGSTAFTALNLHADKSMFQLDMPPASTLSCGLACPTAEHESESCR